ncbi:prolipoprotein diacylglyceryl transferase [Alkalibacterium thalassium]|uniref:Phosphatidylglycerol--prolipoprotein diacylglyceryl transferase n=1 Tax=Alkalibacterium thalassium TaxID=426701 RepID=A0A1G8XB82_9LACT|nr:prolipoprotein diacylglyceryl transferase [Alkalibacterium thalassium]SDJ87939.1 phosphatidylglycerol:prolipoprotein diacylglycerol transferase [Alkalibacterium thalassium]
MNSIISSIDPIAFRLGPLEVAWYGIIIVTGMFAAVWLSMKEAGRRGIEEDFIVDMAFWIIPAGIIGARLYYVLFELQTYLADPIRIFYFWEGGLAIYGGLILGFITLYWYANKRNVPLWLLVDILAPHVMLAQAIGRWGNFINQEAHGTEVTRQFLERLQLPDFIINQMNIDGSYYHPTFLYESVWNLIGFAILMTLRAKTKLFRRGEVFLSYLIWYGFGRFFIEGMRTDSLYIGGGLRVSQVLSLVLFVVGIGLIIYRRLYVYPTPPYYAVGIEPEKIFEEKRRKYENSKK